MEWEKAKFIGELTSGWQFITDDWVSDNLGILLQALPQSAWELSAATPALMKYRPGDMAMLIQLDTASESTECEETHRPVIENRMPEYFVRDIWGRCQHLEHVLWADWDHKGNILAATWDGGLRVYRLDDDGGLACLIEHDLNGLEPNPTVAPAWAQQW